MTDDSKEPQSLEDLEARLRAARAREEIQTKGEPRSGGTGQGMGLGFRIAVELVAGIAVGTLIGYALDSWLGTRPWLMVVFFFLGAAAGVMNVYRVAKGLDQSVGLGEAERRARQRREGKTDE
jgi:ATP synthase protein I